MDSQFEGEVRRVVREMLGAMGPAARFMGPAVLARSLEVSAAVSQLVRDRVEDMVLEWRREQ